MFCWIIEILTESFDSEDYIESNMNRCIHDAFDDVLIISRIDAFVVESCEAQCVVFVYRQFCWRVLVDAHVKSIENVDEIICLIHAKNSILSIANYFDIKDFAHLSQVFDFEHFAEFFFESIDVLHWFRRDIDVVHVYEKYYVSFEMLQ